MSPVLVRVSMANGREISRRADTVKGDPAEPMSERELLEKLRGCLEFGGHPIESAEKIVRVVGNLENEPDAATALVAAFP
jgi:2-methylcitrate dehydratase PrpD